MAIQLPYRLNIKWKVYKLFVFTSLAKTLNKELIFNLKMIDKKNFSQLKNRINKFEQEREIVVRISRDIVIATKHIIYSLHRGEINQAENDLKKAKKKLFELKKLIYENPKLITQGSTKIAVQEYIEAYSYYTFIKYKKLPKYNEDYIDPEYYILGLCDLAGELTRRAVNSSLKNDFKKTLETKKLFEDLYDLLMQLDVKGELRPKIDSIRWELNKLDQMVFDLKIKGKL